MKKSKSADVAMDCNRRISGGIGRAGLTLVSIFALALLAGCAGTTGNEVSLTGDSRLVALENGACKDTRTGKVWQISRSRTIKSLADAKLYTEKLQTGGYDDWRLPTVTELYDLYMIFDLHLNGDCILKVEGTYWSDEADLEGRVGTWELDDNCDPERQYIPKKKGMVRAVRP